MLPLGRGLSSIRSVCSQYYIIGLQNVYDAKHFLQCLLKLLTVMIDQSSLHIWSRHENDEIVWFCWYFGLHSTLSNPISFTVVHYFYVGVKNLYPFLYRGFSLNFWWGGNSNFRSPLVPNGDKVGWGGGLVKKSDWSQNCPFNAKFCYILSMKYSFLRYFWAYK